MNVGWGGVNTCFELFNLLSLAFEINPAFSIEKLTQEISRKMLKIGITRNDDVMFEQELFNSFRNIR